MSREFSHQTLRLVVGHICQNIGWHALHQSSLDILVDILHRFIAELSKSTADYTNAANRTESNTEDVFLAFHEFGITERELLDYLLNVDSLMFPTSLPHYPVEQPSILSFPRFQDSQRPEWIDPHLPSLRPEQEEEQAEQQVVPTSPQLDNGVKRAEDGSLKITINKKLKDGQLQNDPILAEEGRPMREVSVVLMTQSGFLPSIRDGKTADPCHPSKLLLDRHSDGESSEEGVPAKASKKKRKPKVSEMKADKFFDEETVKTPPAFASKAIKAEKPEKKKVKDAKKGKKRKPPNGRSLKVAKAPRIAEEDRIVSPTIPKSMFDTADESDHPEQALYSDEDSQMFMDLKEPEGPTQREAPIDERADLLRGIDDAINTVIENARRNMADESPDEKARKKLQVDDFYELSDSDKEPDVESSFSAERPITPNFAEVTDPEEREQSSNRRNDSVGVTASPLVELVRQLPHEDQPTNEDSSSFLTPTVTITPIPQAPPVPTTPTLPPSTLTVKTLAERKVFQTGGPPPPTPVAPPAEGDDKVKKKDKKKDKKEKKDKKDKKKEVPKLTLKLSSASSPIEQLFAPTPLVSTTTLAKKQTPKKEKDSILSAMVNEVDSDSDDASPMKLGSPPLQRTPQQKEIKKTALKKEKTTPPKPVSPLPPIIPEVTITPILTPPSAKKEKKKGKPIKKIVESVKVKEKVKEKEPKKEKAPAGAQVEVVTVGTTYDEFGNQIWICPACAKPDDGTPMIGCDECDDWYHWKCVGIEVPPSEEVQWFCIRCTKTRKPQKKQKNKK